MSAGARALLEERGRAADLPPLEERAREGGLDWLAVHLAALPRKIGREVRGGGRREFGPVTIIEAAFRDCDLAAAVLLEAGGAHGRPDALFELFRRGDHEERRMILKALSFLEGAPDAVRLLQEAHRTNEGPIFLAAWADTNLPARTLDDEDYARGVLKAAFVDLDLDRLMGAEGRARPELSRMLLDFMSEREAAHRPVWAGSLVLAALAPCPGVRARVMGDIWHGVDARRVAAGRAAVILDDPELRREIAARLPFERYGPARAAFGA